MHGGHCFFCGVELSEDNPGETVIAFGTWVVSCTKRDEAHSIGG